MTEFPSIHDTCTGQWSRRKTFLCVVSFNATAWFIAVKAIALIG